MATHTVPVDVPEEVVNLFGSEQATAAKAREMLVVELLREARISQGEAARLLDVTRWQVLDLMAAYQVPSGPGTPEELEREVEYLRQLAQPDESRGGGQR